VQAHRIIFCFRNVGYRYQLRSLSGRKPAVSKFQDGHHIWWPLRALSCFTDCESEDRFWSTRPGSWTWTAKFASKNHGMPRHGSCHGTDHGKAHRGPATRWPPTKGNWDRAMFSSWNKTSVLITPSNTRMRSTKIGPCGTVHCKL